MNKTVYVPSYFQPIYKEVTVKFWRDNFNILYLHLYAESFWDEGG